MILMIIIGAVSGVISGLGIGGGTLLIPLLIVCYGIEQQTAQNINLIYFIPTAIIALIAHAKEGNIERGVVKPIVMYGLIGAICGSFIAIKLNADILRKIFGGFLFIMGVIEIRKKDVSANRGNL